MKLFNKIMKKLEQKRKLIIDCKPGDPLYMVKYEPFLHSECRDCITRIFIKEIIPGCEWDGGDLIKCEYISVFNRNTEYEFRHLSSHHDDLIIDSDFLYCKGKYEGYRCYTSYQGALDWLVREIHSNISKQLSRLEDISANLGTSERPLINISTHYLTDGNEKYKKTEIYDVMYFNKDKLSRIKSSFEPKKIEVYRYHVELDALGREKRNVYSWEEHFKDFDTLEEANQWIYENDESRWPCEAGNSFYEGYRYYIKNK